MQESQFRPASAPVSVSTLLSVPLSLLTLALPFAHPHLGSQCPRRVSAAAAAASSWALLVLYIASSEYMVW